MNSCPLQIVPTNPPPLEGEVLPFVAQKTVTFTQQEYIELKWQSAYWKSHHARAIVREAELKEELKQKEAIIRDLNQRLYGKTSEKGGSKADVNPNDNNKKSARSRGQQKGSTTHGRTQRPDLPAIPEVIPHEALMFRSLILPILFQKLSSLFVIDRALIKNWLD